MVLLILEVGIFLWLLGRRFLIGDSKMSCRLLGILRYLGFEGNLVFSLEKLFCLVFKILVDKKG